MISCHQQQIFFYAVYGNNFARFRKQAQTSSQEKQISHVPYKDKEILHDFLSPASNFALLRLRQQFCMIPWTGTNSHDFLPAK